MTAIGSATTNPTSYGRASADKGQRQVSGSFEAGGLGSSDLTPDKLTKRDLSQLTSVRVSQRIFDQLVEFARKGLEMRHTIAPTSSGVPDHPAFALYATVGGVEISNDGQVSVQDDQLGKRIGRDIYDAGLLPKDLKGPELAQKLAELISRLTGRGVVKAATALTQVQYEALPVIQPNEPIIDHGAMRADADYGHLEAFIRSRAEYSENGS